MLGSRVAWLLAGQMSSTMADEMVDRARRGRRQHRVASVPDQRVVEQDRQEERERGGPSAPRNSLDLSASNEYETIDVNDDENDADGGNFEYLVGYVHENNPSFGPNPNINEYVDIQVVPPLIEPEANSSPDMTIDLTESPVRRVRP